MNHETVENDLCKHNTESQRCKESLKVLHFSSSCPQFSACESLLIFQDPPQIPLYNLKSFLLAFVFFYFFTVIFTFHWASLVAQMIKRPPAMQETQSQSLGWENPLEEGMATHSSILAWRIAWTEEPGELQSMGLQRAGHD